MAENQSVDGMNAVAADHFLRADADGQVVVPRGVDLAGAEFARVGDNLVIVTVDGQILVVEGFFESDPLPDLVAGDGAIVAGATVAGLVDAEGGMPEAPDNSAGVLQVGTVEAVSGSATALRADGTRVALREGDPLFEGDVLETGSDGALGIVLIDEAAISMGADSHLVLDEVDFEPAAGDGTAHLTALQGDVRVFRRPHRGNRRRRDDGGNPDRPRAGGNRAGRGRKLGAGLHPCRADAPPRRRRRRSQSRHRRRAPR